jgi:exodeoxyribonuclease V beta subunit
MLLHPNDEYPRFHAPDADDCLTVDLGSPRSAAHRTLAEREAFAENLRVLYVALTRAEQLCIAVWGQFKSCETSALGYLLHQPPDAPDSDLCEALKMHVKRLSDAAMRADLERLAAVSGGAID